MTPKKVLQKFWGYNSFRPLQEDIIDSVIQKKNTLALLPTGGGKSLCFQIPAILLDGIAVVISPLVSLMQDQVFSLREKGIKAHYIKPGSSVDEIVTLFDTIKYGDTQLLYLSPERLQSTLIVKKLKELNISFLVVDEAHCISEWGHDFRPSFLHIKNVNEELGHKPIIAVTASANKQIINDIQYQLNLKDVEIFKQSFERKNLAYQVFEIEDKNNRLIQILTKMRTPIIVYTNTRKKTEEIAHLLSSKGFKTTFYHGGLSKKDKETSFENWMNEEKRIMVATNAFGMGIDKENVGVVVHMDLPYSVENYFQEAGRAGRNGKKSFAVLLWNKSNLESFKSQFESSTPTVSFIKDFTKKLFQNFDIANGEYSEEVYDFDFFKFCDRHSFPTDKSSNTLNLLNNNGVLEVSKDFNTKSQVKLLIDPNQIHRQIHNTDEKAFVDTLLRNYTGLFTDYIKVNEYDLAKKINTTSQHVISLFNSLNTQELLEYKRKRNLDRLQFLQPREDLYTINRISKQLKARLKQKEYKLKSLLNFVQSDEICRSRWLLNYFEEERVKECGICDVCLKKKEESPIDIESKILDLLSEKSLSSQEIFSQLELKEESTLLAIKKLLKKEKISINFQNKYSLHDRA